VKRGGSWNNNPRNCRSAIRNRTTPTNTNGNLGFRVACPWPPVPRSSRPESRGSWISRARFGELMLVCGGVRRSVLSRRGRETKSEKKAGGTWALRAAPFARRGGSAGCPACVSSHSIPARGEREALNVKRSARRVNNGAAEACHFRRPSSIAASGERFWQISVV